MKEINAHLLIIGNGELFEELKGIFPDEEEKKLRHRIRSEINTLRQKGKVKRIAPTKWEKLV